MSKEARRLSRIVHDHKGNAVVEWLDAPAEFTQDRQVFKIEDARKPTVTPRLSISTVSPAMEEPAVDSHNPYMHIPEGERERVPGQRTDLRKLSAWIKMMRSLEEAKKNRGDD